MISKKEAIIIFSFCQGNDYEVDFKKPRFSFYNLSNFFEISDITRLLNNYLNYYKYKWYNYQISTIHYTYMVFTFKNLNSENLQFINISSLCTL